MQHIQVDLVDMGDYQHANNGYRYICNVIDHFSKHGWSFKLKKKEAAEVMASLLTIFKSFGIPQILHSDNGGMIS